MPQSKDIGPLSRPKHIPYRFMDPTGSILSSSSYPGDVVKAPQFWLHIKVPPVFGNSQIYAAESDTITLKTTSSYNPQAIMSRRLVWEVPRNPQQQVAPSPKSPSTTMVYTWAPASSYGNPFKASVCTV